MKSHSPSRKSELEPILNQAREWNKRTLIPDNSSSEARKFSWLKLIIMRLARLFMKPQFEVNERLLAAISYLDREVNEIKYTQSAILLDKPVYAAPIERNKPEEIVKEYQPIGFENIVEFENLSEEEIVEKITQQVNSRNWWHSIYVGHGVTTPGIENSPEKLVYMGIPERFDGLSVIDVGTYEGFYAFEAEARGAKRVVAADHFVWDIPHSQTQENFRLARKLRGSQVEEVKIKVEDLSPETVGMFDVVLFLGVLYHAPNPLLYLERVKSITKGYIILETHVDCLEYDRPVAAYYPSNSLNGDPTNFWGPNRSAVEGMLQDAGFREVIHVQTFYPNYQETDLEKRLGPMKHARMVFHAYV